jgi:hypothetical protein
MPWDEAGEWRDRRAEGEFRNYRPELFKLVRSVQSLIRQCVLDVKQRPNLRQLMEVCFPILLYSLVAHSFEKRAI